MAENQITFTVYKSPDGGYEAQAIDYAIFVQAATIDALTNKAADAVRCHFGESKELPTFQLVAASWTARTFGSAKGEFAVPDDFNDPLPKEIEDLFW
jgi:hypothetical protein